MQVTAEDGTVFSTRVEMPLLERMIRRSLVPQTDPSVSPVEEVGEPAEDRGVMQALSVKRRRGLKMKKHKLKKLRKRTRNLRRRIESHSR